MKLAVEDVVDRVVLRLAVPDRDAFRRVDGLWNSAREVEPLGLPVGDSTRSCRALCIWPIISLMVR